MSRLLALSMVSGSGHCYWDLEPEYVTTCLCNHLSTEDQALFHRLIKSNRKSTGPSQIISNDIIYSLKDELLEVLTDHFSKLATPQQSPDFDDSFLGDITDTLSIIKANRESYMTPEVTVTEKEVLQAISSLKSNKAADIHGIAAEHIKNAKHILTPFITKLCAAIFNSGVLPESFKPKYIIPIHKKGNPVESTDLYRGISITPILLKTLEHIIEKKIVSQQNPMQYGFTRTKSPLLATILVTEHMHKLGKINLLFS